MRNGRTSGMAATQTQFGGKAAVIPGGTRRRGETVPADRADFADRADRADLAGRDRTRAVAPA